MFTGELECCDELTLIGRARSSDRTDLSRRQMYTTKKHSNITRLTSRGCVGRDELERNDRIQLLARGKLNASYCAFSSNHHKMHCCHVHAEHIARQYKLWCAGLVSCIEEKHIKFPCSRRQSIARKSNKLSVELHCLNRCACIP